MEEVSLSIREQCSANIEMERKIRKRIVKYGVS